MNEWIQVTSVGIAMIAALASWRVVYQNEKNNKAIIVPNTKFVETSIKNIFADWDTMHKVDSKYSQTLLEVRNHGNTPVFNIRYKYELLNLETYIDLYENERIDFFFDLNSSVTLMFKDTESSNEFYIESNGSSKMIKIDSSTQTTDFINPKEMNKIYLPDYFIVLNNLHFKSDNLINRKPIYAILKLTLHYDDVNFKTWVQSFEIKQSINNKFEHNNGDLSAQIHFRPLSKKKKFKPKKEDTSWKKKLFRQT